MKFVFILLTALILHPLTGGARETPMAGQASWYGEDHRGLLMSNGKKFNPDKLTAASWYYPLGSRVQVTFQTLDGSRRVMSRSVVVTITDRGPAKRLVDDGRIIDLGRAAFERLAPPDWGLIPIRLKPLP